MRYGVLGVHYAPNPSPSYNPLTTETSAAAVVSTHSHHSMIFSVFLALFLPCAGMSAVFIVYICLLWYASNHHARQQSRYSISSAETKAAEVKGLSTVELEKLPKVTGKDLVLGNECAVCLDEIEIEQSARLVPGCNHGFHLQCADTWLSNHRVCPVCRTKLDLKFFSDLDIHHPPC